MNATRKALDDFAPGHADFCADPAGCTASNPCHPCAYWMARLRREPCPVCAEEAAS